MRKFVVQIFLFFFPLLLILLGLEYIVTSGLKKTDFGNFKEWNETYNGDINADLVILGSSRARIHISPMALDTILNLNSYNLANNGHNFFTQKSKFEVYERFNTFPKYIIYSVDEGTLSNRKTLFDHEQFLPYLGDVEIANMTKKYGCFSFFDYWIPLFRYRKQKLIMRIGLEEYFNINHYNNNKYKGYNTYNRIFSNIQPRMIALENSEDKKEKIQENNLYLDTFNTFLSNAIDNGSQIFLVHTPKLGNINQEGKNKSSNVLTYERLGEKSNIFFWDYSQDSLSFNKLYFMDSIHMNKTGADIFSRRLANRIKHLLAESK